MPVQSTVVISAGVNTSAGEALSNEARRAMTVEGIICTEVAFKINKRLRPKK